jgi:nucleoside-diphosphate-sugar epimerase
MEGSKKLLVVFGGTGATGKHLVKKALDSGNLRVRALVRSPDKMPADTKVHPDLEVVQGTLEDMDAIDRALVGAHYVISVAGSKAGSKQSLFMNAAVKQIIQSMRKHGVERFLFQAGAFCPIPGTPSPFMVKLLRYTFGTAIGLTGSLKDNDAAIETLFAAKDIQWVVTRPGKINEVPSKGKLKATDKPPSGPIAYVDVAEFNLAAVQTNDFNGKAPYLVY